MAITSILRNFVGEPNTVTIVTDDTLATITTAGYVTAQATNIELLNNGEFQWTDTDIVLISYAPDFLVGFFVYDATTAAFVANPAASGVSSTLASGSILVGSAGNVATAVAMSSDATIIASGALTIANSAVTTAKINNAAVTSAKASPLLVQYVAVPITASEFNGMYAAPKLLLAAGGAGTMIVLHRCDIMMTFVAAAYAAGGVVAIQYDSTANGAGVIASTTLSAATYFAAASTGFVHNLGVVPQTYSTCANKGLYLSNITQAFTTGDGTMIAHLYYSIVPTV